MRAWFQFRLDRVETFWYQIDWFKVHLNEKMRAGSKKGLFEFLDTHSSIFSVSLQATHNYFVTIGAKRNSDFHLVYQYLLSLCVTQLEERNAVHLKFSLKSKFFKWHLIGLPMLLGWFSWLPSFVFDHELSFQKKIYAKQIRQDEPQK